MRWLILWIVLFLSGCSSLQISEINSSSGYCFGHTGQEYQSIPYRNQVLFSTYELDDLKVSAGPELVTDIVRHPQKGLLSGVSSICKISYSISPVTFFGEFGAGPTYLNIHTAEQGSPGFNFIDQVGAGIEFQPIRNLSLVTQYRYNHISHASLREAPNKGIDSHCVLFGLKFDF